MASPLISVVIASYNYARYLPTAIDSVLAQDDPSLELVIVDNCSTDESWDVIRSYVAADTRVRAFQNETNIGITANHNRGLLESRGTYLIFLSADDFFLPGHLKTLRAIRAEHPECDIAYTTAFSCDERGVAFEERAVRGEPLVDTSAPRNEFGLLMQACFMCLPTMLIPKRYFDELGPFDTNVTVAFDWEMSIRMARAGARFATRRIPTVGVRFHEPQASGVANYYSRGGDVEESLYLCEKYVTPENAHLLRIDAKGIIDVLREREGWFVQNVGAHALPDVQRERGARLIEALRAMESSGPFASGETPLVGVIVTSTGRFSLLVEALASLAAQSYTNWHAYVIRDSGPDLSHLCRTVAGLEGKVSFIDTRSRRGPAGSRVLAATLMDGELVAYLDEDNTWLPHHLSCAVDALRTTGKNVVFSRARLSIDVLEGSNRRKLADNLDLFRAGSDQRRQLIGNALPLNAVVHDRLAYQRVGYFDQTLELFEDWDFLLRLEAIEAFAFVPEITLDVHVHIGLSGQWTQDRVARYADLFDRLYDRFRIDDPLVIARRQAQRQLVDQMVAQSATLVASPQGIFDFCSVLTGALALHNAPL